MKIMTATSEAVPFIKTGGLADVSGALSCALSQLGHQVKVALPCYQDIDTDNCDILDLQLHVSSGVATEQFRVYQCMHNGCEYYLLDSPLFSQRSGVYGEGSHESYPDNLYRFTLFNLAVLELCRQLKWQPDVFHCHDWPTGFIPMLLTLPAHADLAQAASVMTIHNLGYQGDFSKHEIHTVGLPAEAVFADTQELRYESRINMLACGLRYADTLSTVSKTYAKEIQTRTMGHGLHKLLSTRADDLYGILNGVDYTEWNPEHDEYIPFQYSPQTLHLKGSNKQELQQYCRFKQDESIPVIGMVSRLADQKGFRELCSGSPSALERILSELAVQVVIVGTGDPEIEDYLRRLDAIYDDFSAQIAFNNYTAHLVEAGSDFFLMPSRYEPCGLNQIYSLRYGTLPIVRFTGGLADTVEPLDQSYEQGTGFVFHQMSGEAIFDAVAQAVSFWNSSPELIQAARIRGMKKEFSWDVAAREYGNLYHKTVTKKGEAHD
ncbi:MAG: glycogen synthase [Spirochaetota bacterium]